MEEAGFQPLEVLKHATVNGATLLGLGTSWTGPTGYVADLLVVNGNPLDNLHVLNPYGADVLTVNGTAGLELLGRHAGRQDVRSSAAAASSGRSRTASRTTSRR